MVGKTACIKPCVEDNLEKLLGYLADSGSLLFVADPAMTAQKVPSGFSKILAPVRDSKNKVVTLTRARRYEGPKIIARSTTVILVCTSFSWSNFCLNPSINLFVLRSHAHPS